MTSFEKLTEPVCAEASVGGVVGITTVGLGESVAGTAVSVAAGADVGEAGTPVGEEAGISVA